MTVAAALAAALLGPDVPPGRTVGFSAGPGEVAGIVLHLSDPAGDDARTASYVVAPETFASPYGDRMLAAILTTLTEQADR